MSIELSILFHTLKRQVALPLGIILVFASNALYAKDLSGFNNNIQLIDSTLEDSIPGIIYKELIDTIITFNPDTYEETVRVVKRIVVDTVLVYNKVNQISTQKPNGPSGNEPVFKIVEKIPRFPGCEHLGVGMKEVEECARLELLDFVYVNLKYPESAKKNGIDVKVIAQFTVLKDGSVSDINVVREIGLGIPEIDKSILDAAKDVIESMNTLGKRWIPGTQRGKAIDFKFSLPIHFIINKL